MIRGAPLALAAWCLSGLGAACTGDTRALTLPEGAAVGLLFDALSTRAVVIEPGASTPLERAADDGELLLVAYDRPLAELGLVAASGEVALVPATRAGAWRLPTSAAAQRWVPGSDAVEALTTADAVAGALAGRATLRPACRTVRGYDSTFVPLPPEPRRRLMSGLDTDRAFVAVQHPLIIGSPTATTTYWLVDRSGLVQQAALVTQTSTRSSMAAFRDARGTWLLVGEPAATQVYAVDDDGQLTLDRRLAHSLDIDSLRVLPDGAWLVAGSQPPRVLLFPPGAREPEVLVSGAHPDPAEEARCLRAVAQPWLSVDEAGRVWASPVALGLYLLPLDARGLRWSELTPEVERPFPCIARAVSLGQAAELVADTRADRFGDIDATLQWRLRGERAWRPLSDVSPFGVFPHRGAALTLSSQGRLDLIDHDALRPEVPPRLCLQSPAIGVYATKREDQVVALGNGDLEDRGVAGTLAQWLELP